MILLLIEDSEHDAFLLCRLAEEYLPGASVRHARDLAEATHLLMEGISLFDAIITDLSLPDAVDLASIETLRGAAPSTPLIVLTGRDEEIAETCLRLGAQDFLSKDGVTGPLLAKTITFAIARSSFENQKEKDFTQIIAAQEEINAWTLDLDAMLHSICARTQALVGASGAVIEMPEGEDMIYRAGSGGAREKQGFRLKIATSLSGLCQTNGQMLYCRDAETDDRVDREACRRIGMRSLIVAPLSTPQRIVGVIKVLWATPNAFTKAHMKAMQLMANFAARAIIKAQEFSEKERLVKELREALNNVKVISGLLPICSHCKKIRDDKGYWTQVERFFTQNSEASFTHSICPTCMDSFFGDYLRSKQVSVDLNNPGQIS